MDPLIGYSLLCGTVVAAAAAVWWYFPPFRKYAAAAALVAVGVFSIYRKGHRDRAALEASRKEEAVRKAQDQYEKIDNRRDTPDDTTRRLRDGTF